MACNSGDIESCWEVDPGLTCLVLRNKEINGEETTRIKSLLSHSTLTNLKLENCNINDDTAYLAPALSSCWLSSFFLRKNKIGGRGIAEIVTALLLNSTLTALDLSSNLLGAEGAFEVSKLLSTSSTLTTLAIHYNNIGDEGAFYILNAVSSNPSLVTLYLGTNSVSGRMASQLALCVSRNQHNSQRTFVSD